MAKDNTKIIIEVEKLSKEFSVPIKAEGFGASVPVDFLFGRIAWWQIEVYTGIIAILVFLTRRFWQYSIKKYSSFSS